MDVKFHCIKVKRLWGNITGTTEVKVRTRNKKGHYVADDKSTPNVNEAWEEING